jgi:hypothetical protein
MREREWPDICSGGLDMAVVVAVPMSVRSPPPAGTTETESCLVVARSAENELPSPLA